MYAEQTRTRIRRVVGPATKSAAGKSLSGTTPYLQQQAEAEKGLLAAQQAMVGAWLSKTKAADAAAERSAAAAQKASIAYALSTAQVKQKLAAAHKAVLDAEDAATVADSATSTLQARLLADPPASGDGASPPPADAMASSGDAVLDVMARLRESQEATAAAHELRVKNLRLQQAAEDAVRAARDAAVLRANTRATALHTVDRAVALAGQRLREAAALSQKTARDLSTQLRIADKGASDAARAEELRRPPEEVASALHSSLAQANAARALHDLASAEAHHAMFARRVYESFVSAADKLHAALEGRPAGSGSLSSKGRDASPEARLRWDALAGAYGHIACGVGPASSHTLLSSACRPWERAGPLAGHRVGSEKCGAGSCRWCQCSVRQHSCCCTFHEHSCSSICKAECAGSCCCQERGCCRC